MAYVIFCRYVTAGSFVPWLCTRGPFSAFCLLTSASRSRDQKSREARRASLCTFRVSFPLRDLSLPLSSNALDLPIYSTRRYLEAPRITHTRGSPANGFIFALHSTRLAAKKRGEAKGGFEPARCSKETRRVLMDPAGC